MTWAPATTDDVAQMLSEIGVGAVDDLFADIPTHLRLDRRLDVPQAIAEHELAALARTHAARNIDQYAVASFRGGGSYEHVIPAAVRNIVGRTEFATSYTPYQPEVSQGTLQAIFEFQTAISELTGLPVANASLYDGATALTEAAWLARAATKRTRIVVLGSVERRAREVLDTYLEAFGMTATVCAADPQSGVVEPAGVHAQLSDDVAGVIIQTPNAVGRLEDAPTLVAMANDVGAIPIVSADPLSLGVLAPPGSYGAQVAIGDGQVLGNAVAFGGPGFGFMAVSNEHLRRLPGRLVGQTVDAAGDRAWSLTLQAREQHIRRARATSNICTNQSLCAVAGMAYLAWLGPHGHTQLAEYVLERATWLRDQLALIPGVHATHDGPVWREFVVTLPIPAHHAIDQIRARDDLRICPGIAATTVAESMGENDLLVAVTEARTDEECAALVDAIAEVSS